MSSCHILACHWTWHFFLVNNRRSKYEQCYAEKDVAAIYQYAKNDVEASESRAHLGKLDQSSGQLIFNDKRRLESSNFINGLATGFGKITFHSHHHHASNDSFINGYFQNGCLEGLVKGYEYLPLDGIENDPSFDEPVVNFVSFYKHGYPIGPSWRIVFSPDGIVLGYFYTDHPMKGKLANFDLDIT